MDPRLTALVSLVVLLVSVLLGVSAFANGELFVVVAAGPVLVYGGGVDALATPLAVLAVLTNVAFVYYLFKVSRRGYGSTVADVPAAGA